MDQDGNGNGNNCNGKKDLGIKLEPLSLSEFNEDVNWDERMERPKVETSLLNTTDEQLKTETKMGLGMYAIQAKKVLEWNKTERKRLEQENGRLRQENSRLRQLVGGRNADPSAIMQIGGGPPYYRHQAPPAPTPHRGGWQ